MEKISIARRRVEKQKLSLSVPETINTHSINAPPEPNNLNLAPPEPTTLNLSPDSLISLLTEKAHLVQTGKRQFTIEIVSGLKNPFKMHVSLEPLDSTCFNNKNFLTIEEASQRLNVSKESIYRQLRSGNLSGQKIGRQWRIDLNSVTLIENYTRRDI